MPRFFARRLGSFASVLFLAYALPARAATSAIEPGGSIVVFVNGAVLRVDSQTGAQTVVSSATVGSGLPLAPAGDIAVAPDGSLLVTVLPGFLPEQTTRLVRIDPLTGDRTTVSDATTGTGPAVHALLSVAVGEDGRVYAGDDEGLVTNGVSRILLVDPSTGDRTAVSDPETGTGPALTYPGSLVVQLDGELVVADGEPLRRSALIGIDPTTGDRNVVTNRRHGQGPALTEPRGVAREVDGTLVAADTDRVSGVCLPLCNAPFCEICLLPGPSVMTVDPVSGDRRLVSGGGHCLAAFGLGCLTPFRGRVGEGPDFLDPADVVVESEQSFVVADYGRLVRVDAQTGQRSVLSSLPAFDHPSTRPKTTQ
jgi:hypothetical protein